MKKLMVIVLLFAVLLGLFGCKKDTKSYFEEYPVPKPETGTFDNQMSGDGYTVYYYLIGKTTSEATENYNAYVEDLSEEGIKLVKTSSMSGDLVTETFGAYDLYLDGKKIGVLDVTVGTDFMMFIGFFGT